MKNMGEFVDGPRGKKSKNFRQQNFVVKKKICFWENEIFDQLWWPIRGGGGQ